MTITTQDRLVAAQSGSRNYGFYKAGGTKEAAGTWHSTFLEAGRPGAGTTPSVGAAGEQVTGSTSGVIAPPAAASGNQLYLQSWSMNSTQAASFRLYDRLWQNNSAGSSSFDVTVTTAQTWTPVAMPSRDDNGAALGAGVAAWLEVFAATTNAGTISGATISYTNSNGVAGRTGTIDTIPATAAAGTLVPIRLQAGDTGVRSIEGITLGTSLVTGTVGLVLQRHLADIPVTLANTGDFRSFFDIGTKLWADPALCVSMLATATAAANIYGQVSTIEG